MAAARKPATHGNSCWCCAAGMVINVRALIPAMQLDGVVSEALGIDPASGGYRDVEGGERAGGAWHGMAWHGMA